MNINLPEIYLIGLVGLLSIIAILVGRQLLRVRSDEINLVELEKGGAAASKEASELYKLGSVQLKKRLYPQAISSLENALKQIAEEPDEAKAIIENAIGFAWAAQDKFKQAIKHYQKAIKAKPDYPVALNNLAFAKQRLFQNEEAQDIYQKVIDIEPQNQTALKQLNKIERITKKKLPNSSNRRGF